MAKGKIESHITKGADVAYISMPDHPGRGTGNIVEKQIRLIDLYKDYTGPDVYFDINKDNILIGIEILAQNFMAKRKIKSKITKGGDVAYIYMPDHPKNGTAKVPVKQVRLIDLYKGYTGPDLYFDITKDNELIGIEILVQNFMATEVEWIRKDKNKRNEAK